jgi:hypothetical protein
VERSAFLRLASILRSNPGCFFPLSGNGWIGRFGDLLKLVLCSLPTLLGSEHWNLVVLGACYHSLGLKVELLDLPNLQQMNVLSRNFPMQV